MGVEWGVGVRYSSVAQPPTLARQSSDGPRRTERGNDAPGVEAGEEGGEDRCGPARLPATSRPAVTAASAAPSASTMDPMAWSGAARRTRHRLAVQEQFFFCLIARDPPDLDLEATCPVGQVDRGEDECYRFTNLWQRAEHR